MLTFLSLSHVSHVSPCVHTRSREVAVETGLQLTTRFKSHFFNRALSADGGSVSREASLSPLLCM